MRPDRTSERRRRGSSARPRLARRAQGSSARRGLRDGALEGSEVGLFAARPHIKEESIAARPHFREKKKGQQRTTATCKTSPGQQRTTRPARRSPRGKRSGIICGQAAHQRGINCGQTALQREEEGAAAHDRDLQDEPRAAAHDAACETKP